MDYQVFSVESRKGGVGKTTMALNLAKALIKKGYKVLFIDCDVSGTPISRAVGHSVFWKDCVHVMKDNVGKPSNLMSFFEGDYSNEGNLGKYIIDHLGYSSKLINIISSDIYDEQGRLIIDPRKLTDEINSYWFLDLIKDMASYFSSLDTKPTAIVIDNSPGYVGFGKAVRNWMTSLGPKYAHFLLVSSFDEQDINAVLSSAVEIEHLMRTKWEIVRGKLNFTRSEETEYMAKADPDIAHFYYSISSKRDYPSADLEKIDVKQYIGIVFNKMPDSLKEVGISDVFCYDTEEQRLVIDRLVPRANNLPINSVDFDKQIFEQFVPVDSDSSKEVFFDKKTANEWYDRLGERLLYADMVSLESDQLAAAKRLEQSCNILRKSLKDSGYSSLSADINSLGRTYTHIRSKTILMTRNMAYYDIIQDGAYHSNTLISEFIETHTGRFISELGLYSHVDTIQSLVEMMKKQCMSSNKSDVGHSHTLNNLSIMLVYFFDIQIARFREHPDEYVSFLRREYLELLETPIRWKDYEQFHINIQRYWIFESMGKPLYDMMSKYFGLFYKQMCYMMLRLFDVVEDYKVIIAALRVTICANNSRVMNKHLRQYIRAVVMDKTMSFDKKTLEELANQSLEMSSIQRLINNEYLKSWF